MLFIATASYSGAYAPEYVASLANSIPVLQKSGVEFQYTQVNGVHWIDLARDALTGLFLESTCTHLLFIDDDVGWQPSAPLWMLSRDKDIIGGAYPLKTDAIHGFPVKNPVVQDGGIYQVDGLPGGFILIKREVIERLAGDTRRKVSTLDHGEVDATCVWDRIFTETSYLGEDSAFCKRAIEAGYTIWLDGNMNFTHTGRKTWRGNFHQDR